MKKYFVKETDEQVELGDVIEISFEKEIEGGTVTVDKEIKITPITVAVLVELGIIEEREEEEENILDFEDDQPCEFLGDLAEKVQELEKNIKRLMKGSKKK